jgi:hypothetical protein
VTHLLAFCTTAKRGAGCSARRRRRPGAGTGSRTPPQRGKRRSFHGHHHLLRLHRLYSPSSPEEASRRGRRARQRATGGRRRGGRERIKEWEERSERRSRALKMLRQRNASSGIWSSSHLQLSGSTRLVQQQSARSGPRNSDRPVSPRDLKGARDSAGVYSGAHYRRRDILAALRGCALCVFRLCLLCSSFFKRYVLDRSICVFVVLVR